MATACMEWSKAKTKAGYGLRSVGKGRLKYVHRIAMEEHLGRELSRSEVVMHSCDNPACYNIDHLSIGTHAANHADMVAKGRDAKGFMLPHTRLSNADVAGIRWFREAGVRVKDIARLYSIHQSHVSKIVAKQRRLALEG